jgi:hypothetical protein
MDMRAGATASRWSDSDAGKASKILWPMDTSGVLDTAVVTSSLDRMALFNDGVDQRILTPHQSKQRPG